MALYQRGDVWWYEFQWRGTRVRASTKQTSKQVAEKMMRTRIESLKITETGIPTAKFFPHCLTCFACNPLPINGSFCSVQCADAFISMTERAIRMFERETWRVEECHSQIKKVRNAIQPRAESR